MAVREARSPSCPRLEPDRTGAPIALAAGGRWVILRSSCTSLVNASLRLGSRCPVGRITEGERTP
jgi:hypothetical protein